MAAIERLNKEFSGTQDIQGWSIGKRLGYGGFSFAHEARKDGEYGCAKFTRHKDSARGREQQLIEINTELQAIQSIDQENVIRLLDYQAEVDYQTRQGDAISCYFIVLELCPGGDLFDILYYTGSFDDKMARTVFQQIVAGVRACHNVHVAHRDIKAQNVTLDGEYRAKIIDFGSSRAWQSKQQMKTVRVGTKGYQAPELIVGVGYTYKCDVFSLGVLLFVMLTRSIPFAEASKDDKRFRKLAKQKYGEFWSTFERHNISDGAKDLIQGCLMYQPQQRLNMTQIQNHAWMQGEVWNQEHVGDQLDVLHLAALDKRNEDNDRAVERYNSYLGQVQAFRSGEDNNPPPTISSFNKRFAHLLNEDVHPLRFLKLVEGIMVNEMNGEIKFEEEDYYLEGVVEGRTKTKKKKKKKKKAAETEELLENEQGMAMLDNEEMAMLEELQQEEQSPGIITAGIQIQAYSEQCGEEENEAEDGTIEMKPIYKYYVVFKRLDTEYDDGEFYLLLQDRLSVLLHATEKDED